MQPLWAFRNSTNQCMAPVSNEADGCTETSSVERLHQTEMAAYKFSPSAQDGGGYEVQIKLFISYLMSSPLQNEHHS